jgi:branched-chain amino acid transport system substrate-binding protein
MFRVRAASVALLFTVASSAFGAASAQSGASEFKIGVVLPLTGPVAANGKYELTGAYVAEDMVNATGGIGGLPARIVVCDSQSQEQQAVICAKHLTSDERVNLLLGAGVTPQTMAIIPTALSSGTPLFSLAGGAVTYNPLKKWVFKGHFGNDDFMPPLLDYLKKKSFKKVAVLADTGPYGSDVVDQINKQFPGSGVEIAILEKYAPTDTDFSAQITRIRAVKADALINLAPSEQAGAAISKKIIQLGINAPIVIGPNLQTDTFLALAGDTADNMVFISSKVVFESIPEDDPTSAVIADFRSRFAKRYPKDSALSLSVVAADGILIAQNAAKTLGKDAADRDKLLAEIEKTTNFPAIQGIWTLSPASHGTPLTKGMAVASYNKGHWKPE